ncbi:glycoside hydrolase family 26 protein [Kitasatospora sp. NPDC101801]|uniref:glycoside hydrolase family 26 protein n=1 Tax=Kitasatospora sp. NPDC101801 TaxID=3364103 RepID=UPI00381E8C4B
MSRRAKKMHWWSRGSGIRLRLWMVCNVAILAVLTYGVMAALAVANDGGRYEGLGQNAGAPALSELFQPEKKAPSIPDRSVFSAPDGKHFGVSTLEAPWSGKELQQIKQSAGVWPTMAEYFVRWDQTFDPKAVSAAYGHGTLPVLAWEPWAGGDAGSAEQPNYSLASIIEGKHDDYLRTFAQGVAAQKWPLAIRFAHEMNGNWYPWSEQTNGNQQGQYVQAWRHVHDVFAKEGAANVIWIWSPNILRPVKDISIPDLYPGDDYVDWLGMVGYGTNRERTADETFGPTLDVLRQISKKPVLITETGRETNAAYKPAWTADFFTWLAKQPDVIGFIWFQRNVAEGGKANWRFDESTASLRAFANGIRQITLAKGLG